jgi:Fur family ferric uptake transcriptional regulator
MALDITREMEAFREALRSHRLSATTQRLRLAEIVFSHHQHFTAEDLLGWARASLRGVGRVTVYRTLKVLVDAGLVEERSFRRDRVVYEHVIGHRHHDHMVCLGCQEILEFSNPRIEEEQEKSARAHQFTIVSHHHTLFGYCLKCRKDGARGGRRATARAGTETIRT